MLKLRLILCLAAVAVTSAYGSQSSPANRAWPPGVQKVSNESPPLSPEDALKTFYMPPGYRLELVASEPLVQEPVAMDWDTDGRLWVVEMPGFMADLTGSNEDEPIGRVVVLEDRNGDGRMDTRTVFADGLVLGRSIKILDRGVLVAEPPNLWLMRDTNGDLKADTKELVTNQFGRRGADPQENANGFVWGLDNRLYTAGQADIQLRLKNGVFETQHTLQRGEWGVTEDDGGRVYRNTNESALHVDEVPTAYFARNPHLLRTRGSYERLADDNPEVNTVWPVRPNPGTNRAYQVGIDRADGTLAKFTSACGPLVYRGDRLPAELYGSVFVAEPAANLVGRLVLDTTGPSVRARKAYEQGDFLASTDERFRPVSFANAPDGTLYIADMYRGIIEHRISITEYLRDQILSRKLQQPTGMGRIYRVVHETTRRDLARPLANPSTANLIALLNHANGWWRDTAQRLLVERADKAAIPDLKKLTAAGTDPRLRTRALWILDALDAIEPAMVVTALEDTSRDVRVAAVRMAERWLAQPDPAIAGALMKHTADPDAAVHRQVAASIGGLPPQAREGAAAVLLQRYADDPISVDAALSAINGVEVAVLNMILADAGAKPESSPAVMMLTATILRGGDATAAQDVFAHVADTSKAEWQRSAMMQGAEIALVGGPVPGVRAERTALVTNGGPLPCPTCPGGRAGPGGSYAFQRPGDPTVPANRPDRRAPALRLDREPSALTALAGTRDDLGRRAAAVLARVTWPGKPGVEPAAAPLTADEQKRFDEGRDVYRNICQACHQPDGRGQEKLAPPLVGSELALARPEIPARILLHGKEGPIGLMPPIGSTLNDEQVAGVLTYIRREWGHTGSPVDAATVRAVRAQTADRTRPWTDAELRAMLPR